MWKGRRQQHTAVTPTPPSPPPVSHVDERRRGWHYGGLWVLSLGRNEPLSLGYQPSPMTPRWSGGAVLLFHYHRGSRSMERRHHYPSGLMRLSRCRKRSGNYCWYSFQPGDAKRVERDGGGIDSTRTHTHARTKATCMMGIRLSSLLKTSALEIN